jgi:hypothetical protein
LFVNVILFLESQIKCVGSSRYFRYFRGLKSSLIGGYKLGLLTFEDQVEVENILALVAKMNLVIPNINQPHLFAIDIIFVEIEDRKTAN